MKITLNDVGSLIDTTTAANTINANSDTIETAFDNTLSRDGTSPNQMLNDLDMNSQQIINLPNPATTNSPLRLQDLNTFIGGGTITNIPSGGTTGQVLAKNSNTNYDIGFRNSVTSVGLSLPADFTVTNSPVTTTGTLTATLANTPTGTGGFVRQTSPTLTTPVISTIVNTGTLTLPTITNTLVGRTTTDTLVNKTVDTAAPNTIKISGVTLSPGQYPGEPTTGSATAGNVGEYISSTIASGSAVSLTSGSPLNVTSISLTAGDWDIDSVTYFSTATTTSVTSVASSISTATGALNPTAGNLMSFNFAPVVPGAFTAGESSAIPPTRFSLSATTTIFLVAQATFTVSTCAAWGIIRARRAR